MPEIKVPYGVDCESDAIATIDLAAAVEAKFVRGTFAGVYAGDMGLMQPDIAAVTRRKKALGLEDLKMLYFLNNEADEYIVERDLLSIAKSTIFNCNPDAFCVMGQYAGEEANSDWIADVRRQIDIPVFCGTGCNVKNIKDKLFISDGACVGTTFKKDGDFKEHIDGKRVADFMEQVRAYREGR